MDQPGVAYVEGALERFEGLVEISHLGVVHSFQSLDSIVNRIEWRSRTHFLALAAQTMRRVLVESARNRRRQKRGGGVVRPAEA